MRKEYSRILKFDFPTIPILGSLLLILLIFNDRSIVSVLFDKDGRPMVSVIAACVAFLGIGGITVSQLISFSLFDRFFEFKHAILKTKNSHFSGTTYEWFDNLRKDLVPKERKNHRNNPHNLDDRKSLKDLSQGQIHSTLHALEISCREKHPEIASQIEYFYSMYLIFSILGLSAILFPFIVIINATLVYMQYSVLINLNISPLMFFIDVMLFISCILASINARQFKEHLRMKLLNSCRIHVVEMLGDWFQVELRQDKKINI